MKSKLTIFVVTLFLSVCSLSGNAQATIPKGKAQLIEFTNETAKFTVPEGKTWHVFSIFSDYVVGGKFNYYELVNETETRFEESECVRIFLKDLNGIEKTNYIKNIYATQLFHCEGAGIPYPIVFPEKTTFNLIILKGNLGFLQLYGGAAYISLIEVDN